MAARALAVAVLLLSPTSGVDAAAPALRGVPAATAFPLPFTRPLGLNANGTDVFILQNFLFRANPSSVTGVFDAETAAALSNFQAWAGLQATGQLDASSAAAVLQWLSADGYQDDGVPPGALGYKYKVYVPVYANRSIETTASLIAANGSTVFQFVVRAHGADTEPAPAWPAFSHALGLNEFTGDGNTPTGLSEFDLNTPEDDPKEFGPWPVNRMVQGLRGNAAWLVPNIRDGILLHTGAWTNYTQPPWEPPAPMPNSLGCLHAWPESIYTIWQILTTKLGVVANPNTDGQLPYPYKPQGLVSVECLDCTAPPPGTKL